MRRPLIGLLGCLLLLLPFNTNAQNTGQDPVISFIRMMYNDELYEDYYFLKRYCTKKMLAKLADNYDYECEGECYATWLFRSSAQDDKSSSSGGFDDISAIITIEDKGNHWYAYTAYDMGWKFTNWIYVTRSGDTFLIDDVKNVYDECKEANW
ncbi:MAG: hypothetical protein IJL91_08070 [Bacteroidales bacterium]|nr:hypothetical protein [Bacteroidales bacterium]